MDLFYVCFESLGMPNPHFALLILLAIFALLYKRVDSVWEICAEWGVGEKHQ